MDTVTYRRQEDRSESDLLRTDVTGLRDYLKGLGINEWVSKKIISRIF